MPITIHMPFVVKKQIILYKSLSFSSLYWKETAVFWTMSFQKFLAWYVIPLSICLCKSSCLQSCSTSWLGGGRRGKELCYLNLVFSSLAACRAWMLSFIPKGMFQPQSCGGLFCFPNRSSDQTPASDAVKLFLFVFFCFLAETQIGCRTWQLVFLFKNGSSKEGEKWWEKRT